MAAEGVSAGPVLDAGDWEMHKLQMGPLRSLPCGGVGSEPEPGQGAGLDSTQPYRGEPLDSAREMYEGDDGCLTSLADEYYVEELMHGEAGGALETIAESSQEQVVISPEASARPRPSSQPQRRLSASRSMRTGGMPRLGRRSSHAALGTVADRHAFLEEMEQAEEGRHRDSRSLTAIEAALEASRTAPVAHATGPAAAHWPVIDETHKYAEVKKNNWSQTDEDKDLSTIRGIHSTIDFITRGLNTFDKGLDEVKTEIRTGKRDSLEAELRAAHDKYRKQAQWEIDKISAQLEAQRKAQNSVIASAVTASRTDILKTWDRRLKDMEAPLKGRIAKLEEDLRERNMRLVEVENQAEMLRGDKLHLEQKLTNMQTELELGTYSPMVTKLREDLTVEQDRNAALRKLCNELEMDLDQVKAHQRQGETELNETRVRLDTIRTENRAIRRDAVEKVQAAERASKEQMKGLEDLVSSLQAELEASRADFRRQVQIQDVMNAKYSEQSAAQKARIMSLEEIAETERRRVTSFLQTSSVPMVMRELSRVATSKRLASKNGMTELRKAVVTLVDQLDIVIAGLPQAVRMMSSAKSTLLAPGAEGLQATPRESITAERSPYPLDYPVWEDDESAAVGSSMDEGGTPAAVDLRIGKPPSAPPSQLPTPRPPPGPPATHQRTPRVLPAPLSARPAGGSEGEGVSFPEISVSRAGLPAPQQLQPRPPGHGQPGTSPPGTVPDDPPEAVAAHLRDMGHVKAFIESYQDKLRATMADSSRDGVSQQGPRKQHIPPQAQSLGLSPRRAKGSPRAQVPKLVLPMPGPHQPRVADYHIHAGDASGQVRDEEVDMFSG